ncbi:MAG: tetratricopeptide repeat protein, partial [Acidobacteria bacterium]|nr:tetratricopeptide repeat protein [Acidobacteriota bacterium]
MPRRHPDRLLVTVLLGLVFAAPAGADVFHLKDGRRIRVEEWTETETEYVYSRFGGTVAIAKADVARVERTVPEGVPTAAPPAPPGEARRLPFPKPSTPAPRGAGEDPVAASEFALGEAARLREDFEAAVRHYESVLRTDPAHLEAGMYRTACYLWLEQLPFALAAAQEARIYHPEHPTLWFLLGEIHYLQDRLPEALHAWEEALRRRDHPAVRARIEKVRRELSTEGEYERVAGGRFRVRFEGGEGSGDL